MTDPIESPEVFWAHLCSHVTRYDAKHGLDFVLPLIRSRDRAVRREALAPFAWAIAEAFRCEKDIEIRVGSLTTVVTAADVRLALATGDSDG